MGCGLAGGKQDANQRQHSRQLGLSTLIAHAFMLAASSTDLDNQLVLGSTVRITWHAEC